MKTYFFDNQITNRATDFVAASGVTSPWWFPSLAQISDVAATFLPILGALWLVIQITGYIKDRWK